MHMQKNIFHLTILIEALICLIPLSYLQVPSITIFNLKGSWVYLFFFISGLILLAAASIELYKCKTLPSFVFFLAPFLVVVFVSSLLSPSNKPEAIRAFFGLLFRGVALFASAYVLVRYYDQQENIVKALVFIGVVSCLISLYEIAIGQYFIFERVSLEARDVVYDPSQGHAVGALGQPLPYSVFLCILAPLAFYYWEKKHGSSSFMIPFLLVVTVWFTLRRTGYIVAFLTSFLALRKIKNTGKYLILLLVAFGIFTFISQANKQIKTNLNYRIKPAYTIEEVTAGHRKEVYPVVLSVLKDYPLFGLGLRQYGRQFLKYAHYHNPIGTPDNQYLMFFADTGILGGLGFIAFIGFVIFKCFQSRKIPLGGACFYISVMFACLLIISDGFYWPAVQTTIMMIFGMGVGLADKTNL